MKPDSSVFKLCDLKPSNVLCSLGVRSGLKKLVVSDCGLSYSMKPDQLAADSGRGTVVGWHAPEIEAGPHESLRSTESDIFSAALIVVYWVTGRAPVFRDDGSVRLDGFEELVEPRVLLALQHMLQVDPQARASHQQLEPLDPLVPAALPDEMFVDTVTNSLKTLPWFAGHSIVDGIIAPDAPGSSHVRPASSFVEVSESPF